MLVRSADLRALVVRTADHRTHAVVDLLTDPAGIELGRVLVDFSGWVSRHRASVGIRRFLEPDLHAGVWPVTITEEDLEARETADGEAAPSITDRIGSKVLGPDGRIGTILDVVYDTTDWRPDYLVVQTGGALPKDQKVVPAGTLASTDWRPGEVRLDISAKALRDSPSLHEDDAIAGNWVQNVLGYYGIPT